MEVFQDGPARHADSGGPFSRDRARFILRFVGDLKLRSGTPGHCARLRVVLSLFLALVAAVFGAVDPLFSQKFKTWPSEARSFLSPESGLEVIQLTSDQADDAVLYFTGESFFQDPGRSGEGKLIFTSRRSGSWQLYCLFLKDFSFFQITEGKGISGTGAVASPATGEVFYRQGGTVKAVDLADFGTRILATVPEGYYGSSALSITEDGKFLAFGISETIEITTKTDLIYSDMRERFEKRPWSAVLAGGADGQGWHEVARQKKWISHTLINPARSDLIVYCHEGSWEQVEQRLWLTAYDGKDLGKLRPEETPEVQIGHEFWLRDGKRLVYQVKEPGKAKGLGLVDVSTGAFVEYATPWSDGHVQSNDAGTVFVGDGNEKEPYLNYYLLKDGKLEGRRLWKHGGSFAKQEWHPHPRLSPDGRFVLFTSSRAGNGDLYLIRLPD